MKCRAIPYSGQEPFVFFSYCHKDSAQVYPLIERLTELGYRIWFDDGISIGDEWPETIAKKLEECTLFLAAITPDYCCSHNCKNEMTYQVEDQKPMLPLLLEDFPLIGGIKLQLSGTQYLRLYEQPDENWASMVAGTAVMTQCQGAPVVLQPRETGGEIQGEVKNELQKRKEKATEELYAICIESGRVLFSRGGKVILTPGQQLPGAVLEVQDDAIVLGNLGAGQVTLGEKILKPGETARIPVGMTVQADADTYLPVSAKEMEELRKAGVLHILKADATGEQRVICEECLHLGRNYPWGQSLFADRKISRHHADILLKDGNAEIVDCSKNGTYVNDERLSGTAVLADGNEIRMGNEHFHYRQICLDFSDEAKEQAYDKAATLLEKGDSAEEFTQAERLLTQLVPFRDCDMLQLRCKEKLEAIRQEELQKQEALYQQALQKMECGNYEAAQKKLEQLGDYKDAAAQLERCAYLATQHGENLTENDDEETIRDEPVFLEKEQLLIVELHTGQAFRGKPQATLIGRKVNQCDIPFPDNGRMSRRHVELFTLDGEHYVRDCNSLNGTWLNGQMMKTGQTVKIGDVAWLNLAGTWLLAAFDGRAASLRKQGSVAYLKGKEATILGTGDRREFLVEDPNATVLDGCSPRRSCADFWKDANGAWLEPKQDNCVLLNGQTLEAGKPMKLEDGDEMRIAGGEYRFHTVRLITL